MSAPDTNIDKQTSQHRASLWGIFGGIAVVAALFLAFLTWTSFQGGTPITPKDQTRWGMGDPVVNQTNPVTPQVAENPALPTAASGLDNDKMTPMQNNEMTDTQAMTPNAEHSVLGVDAPDTTKLKKQ